MRWWHGVRYLVFIAVHVVWGSLRLTASLLSPKLRSTPSIVEYPLRCRTDLEVTAFTSSITITPGTLVLGLAAGTGQEPATIFVHALFGGSRDAVVADLHDMEDRLLRATRRKGARR